MTSTRLHNLDELILAVRDPNSRAYLEEAVNALRAGAHRAAIVTLWTTVVYDVIVKIRELSTGGDAAALGFIAAYEEAVTKHNLPALLRIEEDIVDTARTQFEMLQQHEATALLRIRQDRHLCAHPAMTQMDTLFQPSTDLVQSHIVHAVTHLLQHQPMQGKSVLERIYQEVTSFAFPADAGQAARFLGERYLKRGKASLVRSLTIVLLKKHVGASAEQNPEAFSVALGACLQVRREEVELHLKEQLPRLAQATPQDLLLNVLALSDIDPRCWDWCGEPTQILLRGIVQSGRHHDRYTSRILAGASKISELATLLTDGFERLDEAQQLRVTQLTPRPEYVRPMLAKFAAAGSWREAGRIGETAIAPLAPIMSAQDVIDMLSAARNNAQISTAFETLAVFNSVFDATLRHLPKTRSAWQAFVDERRAKEGGDVTGMYAYPEIAQRLAAHP